MMTKKRPARNKTDPFTPHSELYHLPFTTDEFRGMPYRLYGNTGLRVSHVGLGTWKFGYPETSAGGGE
jgi:hypothetical protein